MGTILWGLAESSIQLVPDGTLLLHGAFIFLMIVLLNVSLFKPINRILDERDVRTRGQLEEARRTLVNIDQRLAQYQQTLRSARAEGYRLMELQRTEALRERAVGIASVKQEIRDFIAAQTGEIRQQTEDVRSALAREAQRTGVEISSRLLGRPVSSIDMDLSGG